MAGASLYFLLLLLAFLLFHPVNGFGVRSSKRETIAPSKTFTNGLDIVTSLIAADEGNQYAESITRLDSLRSTPTCFEIATALTNYCHSVGVDSEHVKDRAVELENSRKLFAIRLAFCELKPANPSLPAQCSAIISSGDTKEHWYQRKSQVNETFAPPKTVDLCLDAVYRVKDHSEWWTSYSNNKQNVDAWCHLSRVAIEKEEMLETQKSAVMVMGKAASMLAEHMQRHVRMQEDQKRVDEEIVALSSQALDNMETGKEELRSFVESFFQGLRFELSKTSNSIVDVNNALMNLNKNVTESGVALKETFQNVSHDAIQLGQDLSRSVQNIGASLEDLRANQTEFAASQVLYHQDIQQQQRISLALGDTVSAQMANILATTAALSQSLERWFTLISSPWRYYQPLVLFASLEVCTLLLRQFGMISARIALLLSSSPVLLLAVYVLLDIAGDLIKPIFDLDFDEQLFAAGLVVAIVCGLAIWRWLSAIRRPRDGPPYHSLQYFEEFKSVQRWNRL